jgi:hypothetical protein
MKVHGLVVYEEFQVIPEALVRVGDNHESRS